MRNVLFSGRRSRRRSPMMHSELSWKTLTQRVYDLRVRDLNGAVGLGDDLETARLWSEVARRVKLIARKGFRRTIPIYDLEDVEQRVMIKLLSPQILRAAVTSN